MGESLPDVDRRLSSISADPGTNQVPETLKAPGTWCASQRRLMVLADRGVNEAASFVFITMVEGMAWVDGFDVIVVVFLSGWVGDPDPPGIRTDGDRCRRLLRSSGGPW